MESIHKRYEIQSEKLKETKKLKKCERNKSE